jgi:hypothetical protein
LCTTFSFRQDAIVKRETRRAKTTARRATTSEILRRETAGCNLPHRTGIAFDDKAVRRSLRPAMIQKTKAEEAFIKHDEE